MATLIQQQLKKELWDKYNEDTTGFKSALTGGLYFDRAPDVYTQANYPLATMNFITTHSYYTFAKHTTPQMEEVLVDFHILSRPTNKSSSEAEGILAKLETVYDGCSLTLSGWTLVEMTREPRNSVVGPYLDDDGVWNLGVKYRVLAHRT